MCPERLPEERKSKRPACATRASLARRAEHARSQGTAAAQQVKAVERSARLGSHGFGGRFIPQNCLFVQISV